MVDSVANRVEMAVTQGGGDSAPRPRSVRSILAAAYDTKLNANPHGIGYTHKTIDSLTRLKRLDVCFHKLGSLPIHR